MFALKKRVNTFHRRAAWWCRCNLIFAGALLVFTLLLPGPVLAVETAVDVQQKTEPTEKNIWVDGLGSGLHKDTMNVGVTLGAGFGIETFGSAEKHDLALATVRLGWVITEVLAEDRWYGGNLEFLVESSGGSQYEPNNRAVVGLSAGARYYFTTGGNILPYLDFALGVGYTDIADPDLSTKFQFITQVGAGTHVFLSKSTALTLQYRWFHLSNAGIEEPNKGTNTQTFHIGVSWFF